MLWPLRVEYEGAIYHVVNRGDRRGDVFFDDEMLQSTREPCRCEAE